MSVDLSAAESFALASSATRAQLLAARHVLRNEEEGLTRPLRQVQVQLMEAREGAGSDAEKKALEKQERQLAHALRESRFEHQDEAQSLLLRSDLLALDTEILAADRTAILERLQDRMGVNFSAYAQQLPAHESAQSAVAEQSSALDQSQLELDGLLKFAFARHGLNGVTQLAWEWLARQPLSQQQMAQFLRMQSQPTLSNIVDLVIKDLTTPLPQPSQQQGKQPQPPTFPKFGDVPIHRALTLEQLRELAQKRPELPAQSQLFVEQLVLVDQPAGNPSAEQFLLPEREGGLPLQEKRAYLDRLWQFATQLPALHGAVKGCVMFHVLYFAMHLFGEVDFARVHAYLTLPRNNSSSSILRTRSDNELGLAGLPPQELQQRRAQLFTGQTTSTLARSGIFTRLTSENERAVLEFALRQAQRSSADVTLTKELTQAGSWLSYLETAWAQRVLATAILTSVELSAKLSPAQREEQANLLGSGALQQLRSQVRVEFGSLTPSVSNPSTFGLSDAVKLHVVLKGVRSLLIKVFFVHARNFYTKKLEEIDAANLELDGLTPQEERVENYEANGATFSDMFVHERVLEFASLSRPRRGVFVVELMGGGFRARSILRKGTIAALSAHNSAQGHLFRLVDVETAAALQNGSIFLNGQTYSADPRTGLVLVPFTARPNAQQKIVLSGALPGGEEDEGTFASLSTFSHLSDHYALSANFFVDRESLLSSTRAPLLVRANLSLHGERLPAARLLQRTSLRIEMSDDEGTPSTQVVEPFELSDEAESVHQISVPANLASITFTLTGEVVRQSNGEKQELSCSESFTMNAQERTHFMEDFYIKFGRGGRMRKSGDSMEDVGDAPASAAGDDGEEGCYALYCLGKSGEPIRGRQVRLRLQHQYLTQWVGEQPWLELVTDERGCIRLGPLRYVTSLSLTPVGSNARTTPQRNEWSLSPTAHQGSGSFVQAAQKHRFVLQQGSDLSIPLTSAVGDVSSEALLAETQNSGALVHFLPVAQHVTLVRSGTECALRVSGLRAGRYTLVCKRALWASRYWHSWTLHVVDGPLLMNEYLMDRRTRAFLQTDAAHVRRQGRLQILSARQEDAAAKEKEVVIRLAGVTASTRIHVVASDFHPQRSMQECFGQGGPTPDGRVLLYSVSSSAYLKPKRLGDEVNYILARKLAGERVGNMLPRPSLLLHERVKQGTNFEAEPTLSAGEAYSSADMPCPPPPAAAMAMCAAPLTSRGGFAYGAAADAMPHQFMRAEMKRSARGGGGDDEQAAQSSVGIVDYDGGAPNGRVQLEFLSSPSVVLANLRVDPTSQSVRIPVSAFAASHNVLSIVALDSTGQVASLRYALKDASKSVPVEQSVDGMQLDAAYRDTRLLPGLDSSRPFSEHHLISCLPAGGELLVVDAASSTVESYEHLGEYWALLRSLASSNGRGHLVSEMTKMDFLLRWAESSLEARDAFYGEHACHEVNLFLYFKDRPFFDRVVRTSLANKLAKSFVDLYLLGGDLRAFMAPARFEKLNTFERLLLAMRLREQAATVPQADAIVDLVLQTSSAQSKEDSVAFLAMFKAALQCKSLAKAAAEEAAEAEQQGEGGVVLAQQQFDKRSLCRKGGAMKESNHAESERRDMDRSRKNRAMPLGGMMKMKKKADRREVEEREVEEEEEENDEDADGDSFAASADFMDANGVAAKRLFAAPPTTKELEERNWFSVLNEELTPELVGVNKFWADFAAHIKSASTPSASAPAAAAGQQQKVFLTRHLGEPLTTLTEMLLRVAVLDLPLPGQQQPPVLSGSRDKSMRLQARSPVVVFHREMREVVQQQAAASSGAASSASGGAAGSSISVSASYFDPFDLFTDAAPEDGADGDDGNAERVDKYITDEFLVAKLYGCRIVLTNVASSRQKLDVLLQVPAGAVPVGSFGARGLSTATRFVEIESYSSRVVTYLFYFPAPGRFEHYPPSVTRKGRCVGFGAPRTLNVVPTPSKRERNLRDWRTLSQTASREEVLAFLRRENLLKVDLSLLCWRFQPSSAKNALVGSPETFFAEVIEVLRARLVYEESVWAFALLYPASSSGQALSELLQRSAAVTQAVGRYFRSEVLVHDDAEPAVAGYQHLEYSPLLNARAHPLRLGEGGGQGEKKSLTIQNVQFAQQYAKLLAYLSERVGGSERFTAAHKLSLTYYLLLQDRIDEGKRMFDSIPDGGADAPCQLQMDYLRCYFAFFTADPSAALAIARRHTAHQPLSKKRKVFREVENQLMELSAAALDPAEMRDDQEHEGVSGARDALDRDRDMSNLAAGEPSLDLSFASPRTLEVRHENCAAAQLHFYKMNIELMFSAAPFSMTEGGGAAAGNSGSKTSGFLFVTPNLSLPLALPPAKTVAGVPSRAPREPLIVPIPEEFQSSNCWIELTDSAAAAGAGAGAAASASASASGASAGAGGLSVVRAHFAHQLSVRLQANYGQLSVLHSGTGRPLPQTYVKVYAQMNDGSAPSFFKDGYTDLRGKFDYASLSTDRLKNVKQFAILIMHAQHGATVKTAQPPQQ